jgi:hypothetical protein
VSIRQWFRTHVSGERRQWFRTHAAWLGLGHMSREEAVTHVLTRLFQGLGGSEGLGGSDTCLDASLSGFRRGSDT